MNKQQLASKIWEAANQMRSKIEANEYKDYILGFVFYKFLSDKEVKYLRDNEFSDEDIQELSEDDVEMVRYIQDNVGYFIAYKDLFSTWIGKGRDFDVSNVRDALSAFSRLIKPSHKKVFENIFDTLQTGLSKLGESAASQTKAISDLIHLINIIPMDGKQDYDVLGFIYEYLIGMFAANAGKKAGEFYTPHEVSLLMSEIVAEYLKNKKEIQIYDPTSGSGSLLINIGKSVAKYIDNENNIKYYAQELKANTYNLTRMNLVMRGILPDNIVTRNGDTLEDDWPYFDESDPVGTYDPLYVDAVVSNPPYSQKWDPANKENDPRYSRFGLAPKGKADYAFVLHDLYHVKPDGIMTIVLPHGVLFRGGEEGTIRKNLVENNHIDAVIGLPANIFFGTGIPTIIMVLKQKRDNTDILIIDASKGYTKEGKNNKLRACDIKKIIDTISNRRSEKKYSKVVPREEVRANDYNLNIPRYVDSSEITESWDIYASMFGGIPDKEIDMLQEYWTAFPNLRSALFRTISFGYSEVQVGNVKDTILSHEDITEFVAAFRDRFISFESYLEELLVKGMFTVNIAQAEEKISVELSDRLSGVDIIDYYEAYEIFDEIWRGIAIDLEIIQTEGLEAARKVDPKLVLKKKNGKDEEIQEGWIGHIMPFELIWNEILFEEYENVKKMSAELAEISTEYEELLESFTDDEKESDSFTDEKDGFISANVSKEMKQIKADMKKGEIFAADSYEAKLLKFEAVSVREKELKVLTKKQSEELEKKTRQTIENLTDDEVNSLLCIKWIRPIVEAINKMPQQIVGELETKIMALSAKYSVTLPSLEKEIEATEKSIAAMMRKLVCDEYAQKGISEFIKLLMGDE